MIGSKRKVRDVFDDLRRRGVSEEKLDSLCAARIGHRRGLARGDCRQHHRGGPGCFAAANGETSPAGPMMFVGWLKSLSKKFISLVLPALLYDEINADRMKGI
jgi:hypothetical protein